MPITVTATEGVLSDDACREVIPKLSEALLTRHGLLGNLFMTPIVVGSLHILPEGRVFTGGRSTKAILVELKVPSVTFLTQEQRQGFVSDVNAILNELTDGNYPKDKTFVNITYTVDGAWGISEHAWTNAEIGAAIAAAA